MHETYNGFRIVTLTSIIRCMVVVTLIKPQPNCQTSEYYIEEKTINIIFLNSFWNGPFSVLYSFNNESNLMTIYPDQSMDPVI